jgi:hypothetical protein
MAPVRPLLPRARVSAGVLVLTVTEDPGPESAPTGDAVAPDGSPPDQPVKLPFLGACALAAFVMLGGACASNLAEEPASGSPGAVSETGHEIDVLPPGNPGFVCDFGLEMAGNDPRRFPYCATRDLADDTVPWSGYRRLVIAQHGRGADASTYVSRLSNAAGWAVGKGLISSGETFVVAPQFIAQQDVDDQEIAWWQLDDLIWWQSVSGPMRDWTAAGLSSPGAEYSSFDVLDTLVEAALARMPNLTEIIFTGQSAGGQTTQRYALLNSVQFPRGVHVRYLPANPYAYTYLTADRPSAYGDGFLMIPPNLNAPHIWPDLEICPDLNGESVPADYNVYEKGLVGLPQHYLGLVQASQTASSLRARYLTRDVTYVVGEADVTHESDCGPNIQVQGEHRRQRARNYHQYVQELGANHHLAIVPDMGHGGGIYDRECTRRVLFGNASGCNQLQDHTGGGTWGDVEVLAFGNIDGDAADEVAVVRPVFGRPHLVILDDAASGYATRYVPTALWAPDDVPTSVAFGKIAGKPVMLVGRRGPSSAFVLYKFDPDPQVMVESGIGWDAGSVAFGDVDKDGNDELGVTRDATSGTRWYVYSYNDNNNTLSVVRSATWAGTARPRGIVFSDVDWDGADEVAVGNDGTSSTRIHVYDGLTDAFLLVWPVGGNWPQGDRLVGFGFENVDKDVPRELFIARESLAARWQLLDDRNSGFATVLDEGGANWSVFAQPTALAVGRPAIAGNLSSFAVALNSAAPDRVLHYTYFWREGPAAGNLRREASDLPWNSGIRALAFGDVDGLGGDELAYGVMGTADYRFRVLAAP